MKRKLKQQPFLHASLRPALDGLPCRRSCVTLLLLVVIFSAAACGQVWARKAGQARIAVVVSPKIRPYLQALEGVQSRLGAAESLRIEVVHLEGQSQDEKQRVKDKLSQEPLDGIVTIGPEALLFAWSAYPGETVPKVYCMVLNPLKLLDEVNIPAGTGCGVALNVPPDRQLRTFGRYLPELRRIGLIYNPRQNALVAHAADMAASLQGLEIHHLQVASRADILSVLERSWSGIDALWMIPDSTVASESLIRFIIKEAIANNVAVLGFNRFFTESGAALALARNYEAIGRQAAELMLTRLTGHPCTSVVPLYDVLVNTDVLKAVGLSPPPE